ncbi:MAG: HD domain-containing phosphohydrolase [Anaerofustis sp.]
MNTKLSDVFGDVRTSYDNASALKYENRFFSMLISGLLPLGAAANFTVSYFIIRYPFRETIVNSAVLCFFAVVFLFVQKTVGSESAKKIIYVSVFSLLLLVIATSYYHLIGPAVWGIIFIMGFFAMVYSSPEMTVAYGVSSLIANSYLWAEHIPYEIDGHYYLSMTIILLISMIGMRSIFKLLKKRQMLIDRQYRDLQRSENKLWTTLISVGDGVVATDKDGIIEFMNPVAENLTGWSSAEAVGQPFEWVFRIINEHTRIIMESPVHVVLRTLKKYELANHSILVSKDGTERPIEDTAAPIYDENGLLGGVVLVLRDFSEKREKGRQIEYLSYHDQLTGLYNRRFVDQESAALDNEVFYPLTVMYADVNGLKIINDAFGHDQGNHLLVKFADILTDSLPKEQIISRIGGDEFLVLMPNTSAAEAHELMDLIREKTESEEVMNINMSVSFGSATKYDDSDTLQEVMRQAENIMYSKKILMNSSKRGATIRTISHVLNVKNQREEMHSRRVSAISVQIAKAYGLDEERVNEIKVAGELHDIGKIAIDDAILNKTGKLTMQERDQIRSHPEIAYRLLNTSGEYYRIAEAIYQHHERWDGTGYPNGIAGKEIHWIARVIAVADAFDAMCSDRPYRSALRMEDAAREIIENAGTQFDPEIARVFVHDILKLEIS